MTPIVPSWLIQTYQKKFDPNRIKDLLILEHHSGPTWNDGGSWYTTTLRCGDEILRVHMKSDYRQDDLEVTKMKLVMKETYEPV